MFLRICTCVTDLKSSQRSRELRGLKSRTTHSKVLRIVGVWLVFVRLGIRSCSESLRVNSFDFGGKSHRVGPPSFSHDLVHLLGILRKIESCYKTLRLTIIATALMQILFLFVQLYVPSFPDMEFHYCKVLCKLERCILSILYLISVKLTIEILSCIWNTYIIRLFSRLIEI